MSKVGELSQQLEKALARVKALESENTALRQEKEALLESLRKANERSGKVEKKVEELEKEIATPAAPFRVKEKRRKKEKKRPGQKKGHRPAHREKPDHVDYEVEEELAPHSCPHCGESHGWSHIEQCERFVEELPPVRAESYRVVTYKGTCRGCGGRAASPDPLPQAPSPGGGASVTFGPRLRAALAHLTALGLTVRQVVRMVEELFGITVSPGAVTAQRHRLAKELEKEYQALEEKTQSASALYCDETGWWVAGPGYWLWVFATKDSTLYRIAPGRGRNVLTETIGEDFQGTLVSDCLSVYDGVNESQHKCYAHHLKAINKAIEENPGSEFLKKTDTLLKTAIALKKEKENFSPAEYLAMCKKLEENGKKLIQPVRAGPSEEQVANRLRKQLDHLFTFLYKDNVDATNNLAERQLRPAVIKRKISCGNKTPRGARTEEILQSLYATTRQRTESFFQKLHQAALPAPAKVTR